jgi:hypothetical protein
MIRDLGLMDQLILAWTITLSILLPQKKNNSLIAPPEFLADINLQSVVTFSVALLTQFFMKMSY